MSYQRQAWHDYDDTKTELVNMNNGAVVTPERMNHIETGIANSAERAELEQTKQEVTAQLAQIGVNVKTFGAKGNGVTDDTTPIVDAISYSMENNLSLFFPSGIYMVKANAISVAFENGENLSMYGSGKSSIIKVFDNEITSRFKPVFFFDVKSNIDSIEIKNLVVDNNARGSTPPTNNFDYEQSHVFQVFAQEGYTIKDVLFDNVTIIDPAADGFNNGGSGVVEVYRVINCQEKNRTRVRSGIQMSRMPRHLIVDNYIGDSIESESLNQINYGQIDISNSTVNKLDLDPGSNVISKLNSVTVKETTILLRTKVIINNCSLRLGDAFNGRWDQLHKKSKISNSEIFIKYNEGDNTITPLSLFNSGADFETEVEFVSCNFLIDYEGNIKPEGYLIIDPNAFPDNDTRANKKRFVNCYFDERAYGSLRVYRNGEWELVNNDYGGENHAIFFGANSQYKVSLLIDGGNFSRVKGIGFRLLPTGVHNLYLTGFFIGVKATQSSVESGSLANLNLQNNREILTTSVPTTGLIGDVINEKTPIAGGFLGSVCTVSGTITSPATWKGYGLIED